MKNEIPRGSASPSGTVETPINAQYAGGETRSLEKAYNLKTWGQVSALAAACEAIERGRALFNDRRFFQAHEAWEEAWLHEEGELRLDPAAQPGPGRSAR